ncbi:MAG: hypothetical protein KGH59_02825 [Candidatus Micrarchaeota archaeon]|nr:hypothetical protein [Candidatus Micrarchaeota archaeon]MDE1804690.1 hypothetical protein [Candidatus Micrarchaeota archaeon]MDE1846798.1 hypothetical protein [Candidatus Micrarchaeota archaeon]
MDNGAITKAKIEKMSPADLFDTATSLVRKVPPDEYLSTLFTEIATFEGEPSSEKAKSFAGGINSEARKRWPGMRG